jgi:hypothetical protein
VNPAAPDPLEVFQFLVRAQIAKLVANGQADEIVLGNGAIVLRLRTGETFLLGEDAIMRIK